MCDNNKRLSTVSITSLDDDRKFDAIISQIGTRGQFQMRFNVMFNFILVIGTSMAYLNLILILAVPDHWCLVPGRENTNYTLEEWKNLTLPMKKDTKGRFSASKCDMYNASYEELLIGNVENIEIIGCQYGWEYDRTWYQETAPSQENWVCDKAIHVTDVFAFGRVGDVIGTFAFGQIGDFYGRRPVFYITLILLIAGRCLAPFVASIYPLFIFSTMLGSLASTAVFQSPLIIAMEISEEKKRGQIAMMQLMGWTFGLVTMPLILWWMRDWFYFMLATTLPCLLFFLSYKLMIESPRWLASQGKTERCINELKVIAKMNKTVVPPDAMVILTQKSGKGEKSYGTMSLFSNWRIAKNTILLILCWICISLGYYVVLLNVTSLGGNPFLNFFAQGIVELPAYLLGRICCNRFGRRFTQVVPFIIAALACIPLTILVAAVFLSVGYSKEENSVINIKNNNVERRP